MVPLPEPIDTPSTPNSGGMHKEFTPGTGFSSQFEGKLRSSLDRAKEFRQGARAKVDNLKTRADEAKDTAKNAILKNVPSVSAKTFVEATVKEMKKTGLIDSILSKGSQTRKNQIKVAVDLAQAITNKKISMSSSYIGKKPTSDYLKKYAHSMPKETFAKKRENISSAKFRSGVAKLGAALTDNETLKKLAKRS